MAAGDSATSICNIGLLEIGSDLITSLDDNFKRAILCKARYQQERRAVLRAHPWNFAKRFAQLPAATSVPAFRYANAFPVPNDYIRLLNLPDNERAVWEEGSIAGVGTVIMTNETAPLNAVYIYDCADETLFDPLFAKALGYSIGATVAVPLGQGKDKRADCLALFEATLALARTIGSQENSPIEWDTDVWLRTRA